MEGFKEKDEREFRENCTFQPNSKGSHRSSSGLRSFDTFVKDQKRF